jgi:hypothetical protein
LICEVGGQTDVIVGIADRLYANKNCEGKWCKPGVFTNVGHHIEFINEQLEKEGLRNNNAMSLQFSVKLMITMISCMKINNLV